MLKKKEVLFQLIKSLTKEEKRHFKLYVNKYTGSRENNYITLFNAIDKQESYDEDAIKKQFKDRLFIKQLTVTKHYLQKQIIKSLQNLHFDDTVNLSMLTLHHQVAILFKKGHFEICRELVKKGIEVCTANDLYLEWIGFLKWELNLINIINIEEYKKSLNRYLEKTSQLLTWYEITTQGNHLTNQLQIYSLDTPTFGSNSTHYNNLIKKIEILISTTDITALPLKIRFNLLFPLAQSYLYTSDYHNAYKIYLRLYGELINEYRTKNLHDQFISSLLGLIYTGGAIGRSDMVLIAVEKLKMVPEINPHIAFRKKESLVFYPLINCAISGDFYNGLTAIEIMNTFLDNATKKVNSVQYIYAYYYSAYIFMGNDNRVQALKYLRKIDAFQNKELLPNLRLAIKIMEIVIFFDQLKYDLVESRIKSLQRYLQKDENVKPFLKKFVSYFQKLVVQDPDSIVIQDLYKRYLRELQDLELKEQIVLLIHFDLISWLQSKTEGCTFGEKLKVNSQRLFIESQFAQEK
ncbi:MAG: hypothetical protein IH597_11290 [Bacteroidales bacterium]|nr:hypothetical protein [Bacteroidales bacterium]